MSESGKWYVLIVVDFATVAVALKNSEAESVAVSVGSVVSTGAFPRNALLTGELCLRVTS